MAGIAGIAHSGKRGQVDGMLEKIAHRGPAGREIVETDEATLGVEWTKPQERSRANLRRDYIARDYVDDGHFARAQATDDGLVLTRDRMGVAPLYYGRTEDGLLCFASEVKAMLEVTRDVHAVPAGHRRQGGRTQRYYHLRKQIPVDEPAKRIAKQLRRRLASAVKRCIAADHAVGSWLSGGLDSSAMAALARPHVAKLHTFASGFPGSPDVEHAREVADFIKSEHHEVLVGVDDLLAALPDAIYHLESFDALLVRSSITNYLVAKRASDYVAAVFSGEGGDELFAGYDYLKSLDPAALPDELIDIAGRLQNTALQRVDRCASAHGTMAHVCFLDPQVADYALCIPAKFKLRDGVEKWILREAMRGSLPERVLNRTKAKFWEGAGVGELMAQHAEAQIADDEFSRERALPDGSTLNSKEELMYYRIFREHFGDLDNLSWMGRTKGAPRQ